MGFAERRTEAGGHATQPCHPRRHEPPPLVGLLLLYAVLVVFGIAVAFVARSEPAKASSPPPAWKRAGISHYADGTDGYLGQRTACGKTVRRGSLFVAALHPKLAHCGARLTLLYRGKRYHVRVQDRGAWRTDDRALDAAPGLRRRMGFHGVARIRYRRGWT